MTLRNDSEMRPDPFEGTYAVCAERAIRQRNEARAELQQLRADALMAIEWGEFTYRESAGYWGKDQQAALERLREVADAPRAALPGEQS